MNDKSTETGRFSMVSWSQFRYIGIASDIWFSQRENKNQITFYIIPDDLHLVD